MRLSALAADDARLVGGDIEVGFITADSRAVRPGAIFAALAGSRHDGMAFVDQALAAGAVAVLGDQRLESLSLGVPRLIAADPRRALARMAARLHAPQPAHVVAVTGTSGKTSTVAFTAQLWRATGRRAAGLGTLGLDAPGFAAGHSLTTPDPVGLHATLRSVAAAGIDHVAMETSSHGLDQRRVDGVAFRAGAFLNLTRDHLDYHGTEAAYLAAKLRLIGELLPADGRAVVNADMRPIEVASRLARERGIEIVDIGRAAKRFRLAAHRPTIAGQELDLVLDGAAVTIALPVVGAFQAYNLLASLALAETDGSDRQALLRAVAQLRAPAGRMELVASPAGGSAVFVDYAHKPDALEQAIEGLKPHTQGRLIVVFGCGGDRDAGKRAEMGAIAARLADRVIVTDDNPRSEDPTTIRRAILAASPGAVEIGDREQAIAAGLAEMRRGDVLLVAGKGHETGQIIGDVVLPFDDAEVVRRLVGGLGAAA